MTLQLYSVDHVPRHLPIWETILEDLGHPSAVRIARVLDVGVSTVYRWNADRDAPRAAQLALFWLTRWGRSAVHVQATNDATMACGYVEALRREVRRLEGNVRHLAALSSGAANEPLQLAALVRSPGQVPHPGQATSVKTGIGSSVNSGRVSDRQRRCSDLAAGCPGANPGPVQQDGVGSGAAVLDRPGVERRGARAWAGEARLDLSPGHFSTHKGGT